MSMLWINFDCDRFCCCPLKLSNLCFIKWKEVYLASLVWHHLLFLVQLLTSVFHGSVLSTARVQLAEYQIWCLSVVYPQRFALICNHSPYDPVKVFTYWPKGLHSTLAVSSFQTSTSSHRGFSLSLFCWGPFEHFAIFFLALTLRLE